MYILASHFRFLEFRLLLSRVAPYVIRYHKLFENHNKKYSVASDKVSLFCQKVIFRTENFTGNLIFLCFYVTLLCFTCH